MEKCFCPLNQLCELISVLFQFNKSVRWCAEITKSKQQIKFLKIDFQIKLLLFFLLLAYLRPSSSVTNTGKSNGTNTTADDIVVTCNSTQTPCDLSPLSINDELQPQQHHQHSGHCIASFAAIDIMRKNSKVNKPKNRENVAFTASGKSPTILQSYNPHPA